ncbi:fasciclin domain-containing protein [Aurantibacter crassamenti]|uniref:fasciclin domain-containing protein n=1 Tax=Aurantibacter crassamenti TaxID=1837375 RepID=UPI00193992C0|nr:fasciclin domain-containing protein [Aurantibacter crassamenti]MBM1107911.1 fasciclin domain-containing protein [Aurantibacter crassamenti]
MKKIVFLKSIYLFTFLFLILSSCNNSDDDEVILTMDDKNIVETAQDTEVLSSLVAALLKADENEGTDLVGTLSSQGPFTVFAPTNEAFTNLLSSLDGYDSLEDFDTVEKRELLTTILTYHVVSGVSAKSTDLSDGQIIGTVQGENLNIILDGGVYISDATDANAQVTSADIETSNGVVHVINKVLIPQAVLDALEVETELDNIVEIAVATDDLSLLVGALQQANAGLVDVLSGTGPFTVFAPTNAAFADLLDSLGDEYNSLADFDTEEEKALLVKILTYHVVGNVAAFSTDLSAGQMIETVQGEEITINLEGGVFIEDATDMKAAVITADVEAINGVVHVIDKVLLPQEVVDALKPNIVNLAQSVDDLSVLVEALIQADAGLVDVLSGTGPFTVFAPTNAAFAALLETLGNEYNSLADFDTEDEKALLAKILTYHVVSGAKVLASDLTDGQAIETVQSEVITISIHDGVFVGDATDDNATVTTADVEASNGVVHVINKVLLPQAVLDDLNH